MCEWMIASWDSRLFDHVNFEDVGSMKIFFTEGDCEQKKTIDGCLNIKPGFDSGILYRLVENSKRFLNLSRGFIQVFESKKRKFFILAKKRKLDRHNVESLEKKRADISGSQVKRFNRDPLWKNRHGVVLMDLQQRRSIKSLKKLLKNGV